MRSSPFGICILFFWFRIVMQPIWPTPNLLMQQLTFASLQNHFSFNFWENFQPNRHEIERNKLFINWFASSVCFDELNFSPWIHHVTAPRSKRSITANIPFRIANCELRTVCGVRCVCKCICEFSKCKKIVFLELGFAPKREKEQTKQQQKNNTNNAIALSVWRARGT